MNSEIPAEVKRVLIEQEIILHKNTAYQLNLRHRVNKKLGATTEELKPLEDELIKHEQAIDILKEELVHVEEKE